jgi:hypothetical protein
VYRCFSDPANHYWLVHDPKKLPLTNFQERHTYTLRSAEQPCGWFERVDPRLRQYVVKTESEQVQVRVMDPNLLAQMMCEDLRDLEMRESN